MEPRSSRAWWGEPPWEQPGALPAIPFPSQCHIAVIGGGLTGLSAAYFLAERGLTDIAVFEAEQIGSGASGRSGGIALEGTASGPPRDIPGCLDALEDLIRKEKIACGYQRGECWEIAHGRGARLLHWRDNGAEIGVVRTVPCGTLNPAALVAELARRVLARGQAAIFEQTHVLSVRSASSLFIETSRGTCKARRAVLALNAYTPSVFPLEESFWAVLTLAVRTEPMDARGIREIGLEGALAFYTVDLPYLWGRRTAGGSLIFGAGLVAGLDAGDRTREAAQAFDSLTARVRSLHPLLSNVGFTHQWCGPVAFCPDRAPIIRTARQDHRIVLTGAYAGHGVALSVRVGQLIADSIALGTPLPGDISLWGT